MDEAASIGYLKKPSQLEMTFIIMDRQGTYMRNAKRKYHCQVMMLGISFLFVFTGVMDVGIGIAVHYQMQRLTPLIEIDTPFLNMILVVGVHCILLSFIGCIGANNAKFALLIIHLIFTLNGILVSVVMTAMCTVTRNGIMDAPNHFDDLITAFENYTYNGTYVDDLQIRYHCCGPNHDGYKYWIDNIPESCYKKQNSVLVDRNIPWTFSSLPQHSVQMVSDVLYTEGCKEGILTTVKDLLLFTTIMNYVSIIILVLGFICCIALCIFKFILFSTRRPSITLPSTISGDPRPPTGESMSLPSTISVDQFPNFHECLYDRPPTYEEAVSSLQVMEPDFVRVKVDIEMDYLPALPPAYEDINLSS